jgi:head-tail adaptor
MPAAGRLRHLLALEVRSQTPDEGVSLTETFTEVAQAWGAIEATRGAIYAAGMQVGERNTHRITMRWRDPASFTHLSRGTQRWRVREVRDPDGRRRELEVLAEELTAEER